MRRPRKRHLQVESLEGKALLSGIQPQPMVHHAIVAQQANGGMSNALPNNDVQALQQLASTNNAVTFLTQLALLEDRRVGVTSSAVLILNDARDLDLQLHQAAASSGTVVPSDIQGVDQGGARLAVMRLNSRSFTQTYRVALLQTGSRLVQQLQQLSNSQSSELQAIGQTFLPIARTDLMNMMQLLNGATPSLPPGTSPITAPTSNTLNNTDLSILAHSYSVTLMERFLAQFTALQTRNYGVRQYAEKLIADHEQEAVRIGNYAQATGTYLPASIQGQEMQTARHILRASNSRWYDHVYLGNMVRSHTMDLMENRQDLQMTANPTLRQFAMDDISTDWLHRQGAASLMRGRRG